MTNPPIPSASDAARRSSPRTVEQLDSYRLAVELAVLAAKLVPTGHAVLRDQLERAAASTVLNIAEGFGRWQPRDKSHLYAIARGSALEAAAMVALLRARGLASAHDCDRARDPSGRGCRARGAAPRPSPR